MNQYETSCSTLVLCAVIHSIPGVGIRHVCTRGSVDSDIENASSYTANIGSRGVIWGECVSYVSLSMETRKGMAKPTHPTIK